MSQPEPSPSPPQSPRFLIRAFQALLIIVPLVAGSVALWKIFFSNSKSLQGKWKIVAAEIGSQQVADVSILARSVVFDGDSLFFRFADGSQVRHTFAIGEGSNPRRMSVRIEDGFFKGKDLTAAFRWDGPDLVLWLCGLTPREPPDDLSTAPDTMEMRLTLRRE